MTSYTKLISRTDAKDIIISTDRSFKSRDPNENATIDLLQLL